MNGSCHCGRVAYASEGKLVRFSNCHCEDCRKICGSPYSSALVMEGSGFRITRGESELTAYESSPGKFRCFCRSCGTPVVTRMNFRPEVVILRAGTVDEGLEASPQMHIWVKAKAPWHTILDALPQWPEGAK